jgi:phosphoserine phosphatase RsbU/P
MPVAAFGPGGEELGMVDGPSILIVDDVPTNVEMVQSVLATEGFRTLAAYSGARARGLCRSEQPDLVLLDVLMPGESGFEVCAKLKSDPLTADIPIIFLSALDDVDNKVTGLKAGGVDFISKPLHAEEVLARVRVHLRIRETNRALVREHRAWIEQLRGAQQAILARPEDYPDAAFSVYFRPLEETGGDIYDVFPVGDDVYAYFVADISGHGVGASFLTSAVKALLRHYATPMYSPEDTMRGVDSVMRQMTDGEHYLTACYVRLNRHSRRLTVVSAGHPPLILVSADGNVRTLEMDSDPLGVFSNAVLKRKDVRVAPGDRFFLYTDGLIEGAPGAPRREGMAQLMSACVRHHGVPLSESAACIGEALRPAGAVVEDDLLLLAVEVGA